MCAVQTHSSATECCCVAALLLLCYRNTVVTKLLLLLPCYLMSCSLFPKWLRTRPRPSSHSTPYRLLAALQAAWSRSQLIPVDRHLNRRLLHSVCRLTSGNPSRYRMRWLNWVIKIVYIWCKPQSGFREASWMNTMCIICLSEGCALLSNR